MVSVECPPTASARRKNGGTSARPAGTARRLGYINHATGRKGMAACGKLRSLPRTQLARKRSEAEIRTQATSVLAATATLSGNAERLATRAQVHRPKATVLRRCQSLACCQRPRRTLRVLGGYHCVPAGTTNVIAGHRRRLETLAVSQWLSVGRLRRSATCSPEHDRQGGRAPPRCAVRLPSARRFGRGAPSVRVQ